MAENHDLGPIVPQSLAEIIEGRMLDEPVIGSYLQDFFLEIYADIDRLKRKEILEWLNPEGNLAFSGLVYQLTRIADTRNYQGGNDTQYLSLTQLKRDFVDKFPKSFSTHEKIIVGEVLDKLFPSVKIVSQSKAVGSKVLGLVKGFLSIRN